MTDYVSEPANLYGANPELMGRIIAQMKSKGSFDQLRKEILADIDTKPAYQNLRQRLENTVNRYLRNQKWNSAIIKNKLRDSLKRHLTDGNFIHVAPVLNQVLTPDLCSQVAPEVDKEICKELGVGEDEEEPEEQSPSNGRRDGGWDGEGGSGHGFGGREHDFHGGRHNGRVWRNENDFFYPYGGAGYNRFSRRGGHRDADNSSDDDHSVKGETNPPIEDKKTPVNPLSKFDEMEFEYSKDQVVELNRKDNPEEAQKWALQQLAAQKFKIEEELQRMELEAIRNKEIEEQARQMEEQRLLQQLEEHRQQQMEEHRQKQYLANELAPSKFRPIPPLSEPEPEIEEVLEEPKTPEMSDGEDSDVPEMQIVENEEDDSRSSSKDMVIDEGQTPPQVTPVTEPEVASPHTKSELEDVFKVPETEVKPKTPEVVEKQEELVAEESKVIEKPKEKSKEDSSKKRRDERSTSKDDRPRSDLKKEHSSSSSSSSSSKRHSSSSSSKSSSHKSSSSSSSSRHDSSSSKSGSSSSRSKDEKSSSHRSSSSRRDSERHKSSSRSSSSRKDDKYRSKNPSYKKGEDSSNLYYFGEEQTLEMAKNRAHLDEVMIRLELDNEGYESLISDSESEGDSAESFSYQLELNRVQALDVRNLLNIDIPGLEQEEAEEPVPMLEEINANEIMKSPILDKVVIRKTVNGGWNHVDNVGDNEVNHIRENSGKRRHSIIMDKSPSADLKSAELAAPSPTPMESPAPVKRKRIVRKMEQRYSTDDLYKPRPTFTSSRRSRE